MQKITGLVYLMIMLTTAICCQGKKEFNAEKWNEKGVDWQLDDTRENMVEDLISSDTIIGLSKENIIILLGEPEVMDESIMKYLIREKYTWNIDPDYIKYLIINLDGNATAIKCYVEETR